MFAYGTLRKGVAIPLKKKIGEDMEWVGLSQIPGKMYDIGKYPGALPANADEKRSFIKGEVIKIRNPRKVFKILDEYEGFDPRHVDKSEYYREKKTVQLDDGTKIDAWVYWYNLPVQGKRRIRHKDYLDYLKKKKSA